MEVIRQIREDGNLYCYDERFWFIGLNRRFDEATIYNEQLPRLEYFETIKRSVYSKAKIQDGHERFI